MTKLTTHCLDTFSGKPAKGVKVDVYIVSEKKEKINSIILNNNGRSGYRITCLHQVVQQV